MAVKKDGGAKGAGNDLKGTGTGVKGRGTGVKGTGMDRRSLKTCQAIQDALFSLMQEKQYNRITTQDIIDRANVGRSTFYSHFGTKDELLLSSIEGLLSMLDRYIEDYIGNNGGKGRMLPVGELFEHIRENSRVMKGLFKGKSSDLFLEKAQSYWNRKLEGYLGRKLMATGGIEGVRSPCKAPGSTPAVPVPILANHISGTLINLLRWWVENKMTYSPFQMDEYFQQLITPCIDAVTGVKFPQM
ncbi:MAG TPA: TetR/AcrR family transcriptional regulator [Clostridia bacterium]|nr:TetR/AcrR family transcriptional regulator [Clostridia bacterium]